MTSRSPYARSRPLPAASNKQLDGKLDEPATRYIERIHVATDRMFMMIDGVLTYSTINAGLQQPEPVNLNDVIGNIESDLELTLQKSQGSITHENLPILDGAPVLLYQLFYNLVNNSIKFARPGIPLNIRVTAAVVVQERDELARITVQDNGIGFDPAQSAQIFDTFTRLNPKDQYEGTGLGLSLCKKIAERHGGTIAAHGEPGQGATFTITLPLHQNQTVI